MNLFKSAQMEIGDTFSSYEEFSTTLKSYERAILTQFSMVSSEKINQTDALFHRFRYRVLRYQCKQGQRLKERTSKEERPQQRSYKVGCKVMLNVRLNCPKDREPFLKVTKMVTEHSGHDVSEEVFNLYPEQRRILVDEVDRTVLASLTMKTAEQRDILERRHTGMVFRQDVYNMQRKLGVGRGNGGRDDVKCEGVIRDLISRGGHGEVGRDENGGFRFVTFMTAKMKLVLFDYPECLVMDCTYKVNNYLYPLLTIMVIDGEGRGLPVFHAFLAKEDRHIMEHCLRVFASQFNSVEARCFIVDKDMAEISAIGSIFPDVSINLCHFHISQAVERHLKKELHGREAVKVVLDAFMSQVTTESEEEFQETKSRICDIVPQSVVDYFVDHWWSKRHLWAACCNIDVIRFHATTTNTLESYHSKIKKFINEKLSLSTVLSSLISFDDSKITEQQRLQVVKGNSEVYNHRDRDAVSKQITASLTRFGAELVKRELSLSKTIQYAAEGDADIDNQFTVSYRERQHRTSATSCTCSTYGHMKVSCRHIFFVRSLLNLPPFDLDQVPDRFKKTAPVVRPPVSVTDSLSDSDSIPVSTLPAAPVSLRTVEGRYKRAKAVCDRAASFLSILGVDQFQQKLNELEEFINQWWSNVDDAPHAPVSFPTDVAVVDSEDYVVVSVHSNTDDTPVPYDTDVNPVSAMANNLASFSGPIADPAGDTPVDTDVNVNPVSADVTSNNISSFSGAIADSAGDTDVNPVSADVASNNLDSFSGAIADFAGDTPVDTDVNPVSVDVTSNNFVSFSGSIADSAGDTPVDTDVNPVSADVTSNNPASFSGAITDSIDDVSVPAVNTPVPDDTSNIDSVPSGNNLNPAASDDFSCSWPKMTRLLKPRGRPGTRQRFTKSKCSLKRHRPIPKKFQNLNLEEQENLLIDAVSCHQSKPSQAILLSDLKPFVDFGDTVLDEKVDMSIIRPFFESSAWEVVVDGVESRIEGQIFHCGQCKDIDEGKLKMVQCDRCLQWSHFQCVGYSSKRKTPLWFCENCML